METDKTTKNIKLGLTLLWLTVFSALSATLAGNLNRLIAAVDRQEALYAGLGSGARAAAAFTREIDLLDDELSYLDKLAAMYTENKGSFRTQNAIAAEVKELRRKIGQKVEKKIYIVVDSRANKLFLKRGLDLLLEADCSVGRGGTLKDKKSGRIWEFVTPRGDFSIRYKMEAPLWLKPDWAFVESGQPVPPPGDPSRTVAGELGKYALDIGNGYLIHGTKNEDALGAPVSHGCVRLGGEALERLYREAPVGTRVYIY